MALAMIHKTYMAYVKIWIHAVWGTKKRFPFLNKEVKEKVIVHIKENAKKKQIYIDCLNGVENHLHCLFALNADMSIAKAMQLIKGESSFWINKENITKTKFEWADEYYAASLDDAGRGRVREYIKNQEEHHRRKSFSEVYEQFMSEANEG